VCDHEYKGKKKSKDRDKVRNSSGQLLTY
jgi:hypothetical protein